jgi:hypothetical protein
MGLAPAGKIAPQAQREAWGGGAEVDAFLAGAGRLLGTVFPVAEAFPATDSFRSANFLRLKSRMMRAT